MLESISPSPLRLLLKALVLFSACALLLGSASTDSLARLTLYNDLFPGRERLPFGEDQEHAYNLSLYSLDAMIASHEINAKPSNDAYYDVVLLGDSSVWGTLLTPDQTLAGQLNALHLTICGKPARFYNLGYPSLSLTKDLMILDRVMVYKPDQIAWLTTLESFPRENQLAAPILENNPEIARSLISRFGLKLDPRDPDLVKPSLWSNSLIGQRRNLADLVRLQLYGVMWAATGIDQVYPADYQHAATNLAADDSFHRRQPPVLDPALLSFDVLEAGIRRAGPVPVLLINEPILVSKGANSDIRYNFFYPRWAYDQYRSLLAQLAADNSWDYIDLWNLVPADQFTNTAIHLSPKGEQLLTQEVALKLGAACKNKEP